MKQPMATNDLINQHDLARDPGRVFYRPTLTIDRKRPDVQRIAAVYRNAQSSPGDTGCTVSLLYHFGRAEWCCMTEYNRQKASDFEFGTLAEAAGCFAFVAQVDLPPIVVTEYGVGIYKAGQSPSTAENPWAVSPGDRFEVTDPTRGQRVFEVVRTKYGMEIATVVDGQRERETFPFAILSPSEWKTFQLCEPVQEEACEAPDAPG